jgi:hypothetical protein
MLIHSFLLCLEAQTNYRRVKMSVRATDSLIADLVVATGIPNSPKMVVQAVDAEKKLVTTVWFSDNKKAETAVFPAGSLDRAEVKAAAPARKPILAPAARGRKPKK